MELLQSTDCNLHSCQTMPFVHLMMGTFWYLSTQHSIRKRPSIHHQIRPQLQLQYQATHCKVPSCRNLLSHRLRQPHQIRQINRGRFVSRRQRRKDLSSNRKPLAADERRIRQSDFCKTSHRSFVS